MSLGGPHTKILGQFELSMAGFPFLAYPYATLIALGKLTFF